MLLCAGFADTVTSEMQAQFKSRLASALAILEQAKAMPAKCPRWWSTRMTVALGQAEARPPFEKIFEEAKAIEPQYFGYDLAHSKYPDYQAVPNVNCRLACYAGDREQAKKLLAEIGDEPFAASWRKGEFKVAKAWAMKE